LELPEWKKEVAPVKSGELHSANPSKGICLCCVLIDAVYAARGWGFQPHPRQDQLLHRRKFYSNKWQHAKEFQRFSF